MAAFLSDNLFGLASMWLTRATQIPPPCPQVICEIPLKVSDFSESYFAWLKRGTNLLFLIEASRRFKLLSIKLEPAREIQSASLAESKICTHSSWNRDESLLAIVVDKRQVYLWEVKTNAFTHFKPNNGQTSGMAGRKNRAKDIDLIAWSKQSDKLAICYYTGQILLCKFAHQSSVSERFIDNSESVLKRIVSIEVSEHADMFACFSIISEVLVMTFDGQTKFYIQGNGLNLFNAKFSYPICEYGKSRTGLSRQQAMWLAYQSKSDGLFFKKISFDSDEFQDVRPKLDVLHDKNDEQSRLIDFYWLTSSQLIACFSSGALFLAQLTLDLKLHQEPAFGLACEEILRIRSSSGANTGEQVGTNNNERQASKLPVGKSDSFKFFQLINCQTRTNEPGTRRSFALVAATDYKLFYYELYENEQHQFNIEHVDHLDLSSSLQRINLRLERASWSSDCSMLAVQLTSGHILVYRTRLQDYMVASYGSRAAYLSSTSEITVLNYGLTADSMMMAPSEGQPSSHSRSSIGDGVSLNEMSSDNALIIDVGLKPSVIAIGPRHLALALNNRVRLYPIGSSCGGANRVAAPLDEQEFATIVTSLSLCSRFVAILFDDGRLKLQAIGASASHLATAGDQQQWRHVDELESAADERFFPDPARPESISTLILTEDLLVYCTREHNINIFRLKNWNLVQVCNYSKLFAGCVQKLRANESGNKFVCLVEEPKGARPAAASRLGAGQLATDTNENVFLYDLYTNKVFSLFDCDLFGRIWQSQLDESAKLVLANASHLGSACAQPTPPGGPLATARLVDAIWDTDGRTLVLVERELVHIVAILDHTLNREGPTVEYADSARKPSSYTILFASQGIVSYQTSLGRVINCILESHDDELKLAKLERRIQQVIKEKWSSRADMGAGEPDRQVDFSDVDRQTRLARYSLETQSEIMGLKLCYLRTILPIYSLAKCRDICDHLMSDEQFNHSRDDNDHDDGGPMIIGRADYYRTSSRVIQQLIWKELAAWAIHCLSLDFALSVYRKHELLVHARLLAAIIDDLRLGGLDSRASIVSRLLLVLGCDK